MKHRILSMLALPLIAVSGAWAQGPWTSGDCTVTFNDATLTISGNGAMEEVMEDVPGWFSTLRSVDRVVVEEGVTTLCPYAFYGEKKGFVDSFTLPSTLTKIGMAAFAVQNDEAFTTITIPANVTEIGDNAFAMCSNLAVINCYANPAKLVCGDNIFTCEDFPQFHVPSNYYDQYVADFSDKMNVTFVGDLPAQGSSVTTGYKVELTALFEYDGADPEEGDGSTVVSSLPIEKTMLGWFHIVNPEFEPDAEVSIDDASGPSITVGEDHSWNTLVTVGAPGTYTVHAHWVGSDFVGDYITITAVVSELGQEPVPVTVTAGETANQWTLDMPAGNVEVSVEYYQPAELAWKQGTAAVPEGGVSAYKGFPTTLPALANPNSHTVSYTSSNPAAATIDADGKITLVGAGTTTIQAIFAGDDTYEDNTVSYTLNVALPASLILAANNSAWGKVKQTNYTIVEDCEDYTEGKKLAQSAIAAGNDWWTTWNNNPGSSEDGSIAKEGDNACLKVSNGTDQVLKFGNVTTGVWEYAFDAYVPENNWGYFNILHQFDGGQIWAIQCYLNATHDGSNGTYAPGHGTVHAGSNSTADLKCVLNEWMHLRFVIDIDNDLARLYFNGELQCQWQWSQDTYGESVYGGQLAASNIYGAGGDFYVDNISFRQIPDIDHNDMQYLGNGQYSIIPGTEVTAKATPADGYHLDCWSNNAEVNDAGTQTFTMGEDDMELTAFFEDNTPTNVATFAAANVFTIEGGKAVVKVNADARPLNENQELNVKAGSTITIEAIPGYKIKSVKVKKDGSAPLKVPLTMEALTDGTIVVSSPQAGMQYTLNGGEKKAVTADAIEVVAGDKVAFYGNGTSISKYYVNWSNNTKIVGGTADVMVYGNIMSLVDEENYATATTLTEEYVFYDLFNGNTHLLDASDLLLPATTLSNYCYCNMFYKCTNLTVGPELPATTLTKYCYYMMFLQCTSLAVAPELPATTLAEYCYFCMFSGCSSLTVAPELPATTLAEECYNQMFTHSGLTVAPELPATTLAPHCYGYMFWDCQNLTTAPALPATTLAEYCYGAMFQECPNLTTAPVLPATTMVEGCYNYMFNGCTQLNSVTCLATSGLNAKNCTQKWLEGAAATGTFTASSSTNWTKNSVSGIPSGWTRVNYQP